MKELFPLNTFQQDAVLKRLNDFYELLKDVDVEYTESVATFTFDGNVTIEEDLRVKGGASITGSIGAASASFPIINGESNPSVKPIYYHPISIWSKINEDNPINSLSLSLIILGNLSSSFPVNRLDLFIQWCRENNITYLSPVSGFVYNGTKQMVIAWIDIGADHISIRGHLIDDTTNGTLKSVIIYDTDFGNYNLDDTGVNKIN